MQARIFETKLGWMGIASRGVGVSHVLLPSKSRAKIEKEMDEITKGEYEPSRSLLALESDMIRAMNGRFVDLSKYPLDFTFSTPFQKSIWFALKDIPYGRTVTYKELAEKIGKPKSSQAVGNALAKNPLPILLPCHRVLSESGLGGYKGGPTLKKKLLKMEGVNPPKK